MTKMYMRQVSSCGGKIKLDALSCIEENLYKALHRVKHVFLVLTVVVRGRRMSLDNPCLQFDRAWWWQCLLRRPKLT
ncbi:hypothetical protein OUZ56_020406 [Daphnia magna]|uniref:Uncharacterized protein n=1 Tax=Daphnia magna TaxID=35525 RepID=A0ABQ9ZEE0_9CRUS|nr:hypothetical protein OUZ56_020406 [Daphnia magna]